MSTANPDLIGPQFEALGFKYVPEGDVYLVDESRLLYPILVTACENEDGTVSVFLTMEGGDVQVTGVPVIERKDEANVDG